MPKKHSRTVIIIVLFLLIYYFAVTFLLTGNLIFENIIKMKFEEKALIVLGGFAVAFFAFIIEKNVRI